MPGIDRTRPEDMEPIDAAAYLCWGSGRGDLYDAIHAMKKDNRQLREALQQIDNLTAHDPYGPNTFPFAVYNVNVIARSALQQKVSV